MDHYSSIALLKGSQGGTVSRRPMHFTPSQHKYMFTAFSLGHNLLPFLPHNTFLLVLVFLYSITDFL
jgi:hypothetical protein